MPTSATRMTAWLADRCFTASSSRASCCTCDIGPLRMMLAAKPRQQPALDACQCRVEDDDHGADREHTHDHLRDVAPILGVPDEESQAVAGTHHLGADHACPGDCESHLEPAQHAWQRTGNDDLP